MSVAHANHTSSVRGGGAFIAQWTGVRLSYVLDLVGVDPRARDVVFFPFDDLWDSLDMADALHPRTLSSRVQDLSSRPDNLVEGGIGTLVHWVEGRSVRRDASRPSGSIRGPAQVEMHEYVPDVHLLDPREGLR